MSPTFAPPSPDARPTLAEAAARLADWGFLAHPDLPDRPGPAWLLVAIRDRPTLDHFDPEVLELWVHAPAGGRRLEVGRSTTLPIARDFSWGEVRIVDRRGVSNDYVTFGGRLEADEIDGALVCVLSSPAPLLRLGGHSQPVDAGSLDVGAFYARLMVAVVSAPGFEAALGLASPLGRYAAFVRDLVARYRRAPVLQAHHPVAWAMLRGEASRLEGDHPVAWAEGRALLEMAGLD